ncbi:unnamed protein product [Orchesella dallaii]|uniref:Uncharacterized protein n=1 Tax=Orchesella dallaii TaxID=48710 RepID=A0ABP1S383_9HEXA
MSISGGSNTNILDSNGIAWESDKSLRFKKPQIPNWSDITNYFELPKGVICLLIGPLLYLVEFIAKLIHRRNLARGIAVENENDQNDEPDLPVTGSNTTLKSASSAFAASL